MALRSNPVIASASETKILHLNDKTATEVIELHNKTESTISGLNYELMQESSEC